jgi:hypothetical protein
MASQFSRVLAGFKVQLVGDHCPTTQERLYGNVSPPNFTGGFNSILMIGPVEMESSRACMRCCTEGKAQSAKPRQLNPAVSAPNEC